MRNPRMTTARRFVSGSFVLALITFAAACVVETREGIGTTITTVTGITMPGSFAMRSIAVDLQVNH